MVGLVAIDSLYHRVAQSRNKNKKSREVIYLQLNVVFRKDIALRPLLLLMYSFFGLAG